MAGYRTCVLGTVPAWKCEGGGICGCEDGGELGALSEGSEECFEILAKGMKEDDMCGIKDNHQLTMEKDDAVRAKPSEELVAKWNKAIGGKVEFYKQSCHGLIEERA